MPNEAIATTTNDPHPLHSQQTLTIARLVIGLAQGLALYLLYLAADGKTWPSTDPYWMAPLVLVSIFVPLLVQQALGTMRLYTLIVWTGAAFFLLATLAWYDIWRQWAPYDFANTTGDGAMTFALFAVSSVGLFIAQSLIAAGDAERRYIASYAGYFEAAWKLGVQLALAAVFVGVFWGVLWLGAVLFELIRLNFIETLIEKPWFAIPASTLAMAVAIHVTDVRARMVAGIGTVVLTLLSWLLPLMTLIAVGFTVSLPFTGLAPLWATESAAGLLLASAAMLVVLINAAFQDGDPAHSRPAFLRYAELAAAIVLVPLVLIATHALWLRVAQYGWTVERIATAATIVIALCYAFGYAAAAILSFVRGGWMQLLERVNIATAFVVLAILLLIFSPLGDPARLAVNSQVARLKSGAVTASAFDFRYLQEEGGRYGRSALTDLSHGDFGKDTTAIRTSAKQALDGVFLTPETPTKADLTKNVTMHPAGAALPHSFVVQDWSKTPGEVESCLTNPAYKCDAVLVDVDGDGASEVVLDYGGTSYVQATIYRQGPDKLWIAVATFSSYCKGAREAVLGGTAKLVAPEWTPRDWTFGNLRIQTLPITKPVTCPM